MSAIAPASGRLPARARGVVLILVLVMIAVAAMVSASLLYRMRAETSASSVAVRQEQAWQAAMAGLRLALATVAAAPQDDTAWTDRPELFQEQVLASDGADTWRFTVFAPADQDDRALRYGVTDLAGRISLNDASQSVLLALPGMTAPLAQALLDYIDADAETRPSGAEQEWYQQRSEPAPIRNGPLQTIEELLAVRGFSAELVFGEDANFNHLLDPNEDDGDGSFPPDDSDGRLNPGLRRWFTVWSREPDVDAQGQPRLDLNGDLEALAPLQLPESAINAIRRYHEDGHRFTDPSQLLNMRYVPGSQQPLDVESEAGDDDLPGPMEGVVGDVLPPAEGEPGDDEPGNPRLPAVESGLGGEHLLMLLDRLTVPGKNSQAGYRQGRINVHTASPAVLACVPGLDEDSARQIVDLRNGLDADTRSTIAWLFTLNVLDEQRFKRAAPYLTARGYQFHIQCVGYGLPSGRYCVIEAVVDLSGAAPRVVYLRELTRAGVPFPLLSGS